MTSVGALYRNYFLIIRNYEQIVYKIQESRLAKIWSNNETDVKILSGKEVNQSVYFSEDSQGVIHAYFGGLTSNFFY